MKGKVILIEVNDSNNEINFFPDVIRPLFGSLTGGGGITFSAATLPRSFVIDYII
ncbi:MAG: hypothetical protein MZV63_47080 [Marinilabiliales bacterium]|nr:hypothetical protein [Marinilabiliales bacterium]